MEESAEMRCYLGHIGRKRDRAQLLFGLRSNSALTIDTKEDGPKGAKKEMAGREGRTLPGEGDDTPCGLHPAERLADCRLLGDRPTVCGVCCGARKHYCMSAGVGIHCSACAGTTEHAHGN